jgi:hypothetical protein
MALTRKTVTSKITSSAGCRLWHRRAYQQLSHIPHTMLQKYIRLTRYMQRTIRNRSAVLNTFLKLRNWNCVSYSSFIIENDAADILTTAWDLFMYSLIYLFIYSVIYLFIYWQSTDPAEVSTNNPCFEPVAYPGIFFPGEGGCVSTNSVEDRGQRELGSGGGSPLVRGSGGSCNLVQEILFHIVKCS